MSSSPPKAKFRGKRGGDPNRRSQRQRHDRGLVSHLDFFDPENFESDRRQQQRREDRSRSATKAGAVAKEKAAAASDRPAPLPPPPLRNTSEVRSVPAPRTVVTTSTVISVPARPIAPPARPGDGGEGSWQLAWVWTPVAAEGTPGEAVPVTPPKAPPAKAGTARRRSRSPIRRKISKPSAAPDRASVLAQEAASLAEALETAESAAVAESLAPAEPKVSAKKAKSPKQKRTSSKPSSVPAPKDTSGVAKPSAKGTSSSSLTTSAVGVPAAVKSAPASGSKPPPKKIAAAAKGSLTSSRRPRWSLCRSRSQLCLRRKATQFLCWAVAVRQIPQGLLNARCWALIGIAQSPTNAKAPVGVRRLFLLPPLLEFKSWLKEGTTSVSSLLRRQSRRRKKSLNWDGTSREPSRVPYTACALSLANSLRTLHLERAWLAIGKVRQSWYGILDVVITWMTNGISYGISAHCKKDDPEHTESRSCKQIASCQATLWNHWWMHWRG